MNPTADEMGWVIDLLDGVRSHLVEDRKEAKHASQARIRSIINKVDSVLLILRRAQKEIEKQCSET